MESVNTNVPVPSIEKIAEMCDIVSRQTEYTQDQIKDKLIEYNYEYMDVIKEYMGIEKEKPRPIKSINQEIYKQIRLQLDTGIRAFNDKQHKKIVEELQIADTYTDTCDESLKITMPA